MIDSIYNFIKKSNIQEIRRKKCIMIIGNERSGKSTTVNLLLGIKLHDDSGLNRFRQKVVITPAIPANALSY